MKKNRYLPENLIVGSDIESAAEREFPDPEGHSSSIEKSRAAFILGAVWGRFNPAQNDKRSVATMLNQGKPS